RRDPRRRVLRARSLRLPPAGRQPDRAGELSATVQVIDRELDRLEGLWSDGLSDSYRVYLESVGGFQPDVQPRLALAAALIEVGVRLQGLGGSAAAPTTLLRGDHCLARGSRPLADHAPLAVQVAFARAIESLASAAASAVQAAPARQLLHESLGAT